MVFFQGHYFGLTFEDNPKPFVMARKPLSKRFNRKIIEVGQSSLCVTLPVEYLELLGWEKGQEVHIRIRKRRKQLLLQRVK
jgi:hypothetical protein